MLQERKPHSSVDGWLCHQKDSGGGNQEADALPVQNALETWFKKLDIHDVDDLVLLNSQAATIDISHDEAAYGLALKEVAQKFREIISSLYTQLEYPGNIPTVAILDKLVELMAEVAPVSDSLVTAFKLICAEEETLYKAPHLIAEATEAKKKK